MPTSLARSFEEAVGPVALEADLAVGGVVADCDVVLLRELDDPGVEVNVCNGAGGVVGVVNPEDPGPGP